MSVKCYQTGFFAFLPVIRKGGFIFFLFLGQGLH